jgi:DNA-3-methyladenine glycosylase I
MTRCHWADSSALMTAYHDTEWGFASHDDNHLFEMLLLEGAQAGLSWSTVLNKRENYREALDGFDFARIASYQPSKLADLLVNPGIIRNRLKVAATVKNAGAFLAVRDEFGTFDDYLWAWVDGKPIVNRPGESDPAVPRTELSDRISKDLKKRGFTFVGSTIVYAYMQATGVVNDHLATCEVLERTLRSTQPRSGS